MLDLPSTAASLSRREFLGAIPLAAAAFKSLASDSPELRRLAPTSGIDPALSPHLLNFGSGPCIGLGGEVVISTAHQGIPDRSQGRRARVHQLIGPRGEATDLVLFRMKGLNLPRLELGVAHALPTQTTPVISAGQGPLGLKTAKLHLNPQKYAHGLGDSRLPYQSDCHCLSTTGSQGLSSDPPQQLTSARSYTSGSGVFLAQEGKPILIGVMCLRREALGVYAEEEIGYAADITGPHVRNQIQQFLSGELAGSLFTPLIRHRAQVLGEWGIPVALLFSAFGLGYYCLQDGEKDSGKQRQRLDLKLKY